MRGTEGTTGEQGVFGRKCSGNRVYFSGFQGFPECQRRKDGGQSLCQHGFACTGWPDQKNVVSSRGGNFQGTFHGCLAFDICKIMLITIHVQLKFLPRSTERCGGTECGSTGRYRG